MPRCTSCELKNIALNTMAVGLSGEVGNSSGRIWPRTICSGVLSADAHSGCFLRLLTHWHRASGIQQFLRCFIAIELGKFDVGSFRPSDNMILQ